MSRCDVFAGSQSGHYTLAKRIIARSTFWVSWTGRPRCPSQPALREVTLKRTFCLFAASFLLFAITSTARAQQFDVAFGFGTVGGNPASDASAADVLSGSHTPQYIGGGGYPSFSGDFLFFGPNKSLGVGGQVAWRAHQNIDIFGEPYRPILYDFNLVFAPSLGKRAQAELQAGIGALSLRFYQGFFTCNFIGCTDYSSS